MAPVRPFQLLVKPVGADCNQRCAYCFYNRAGELYPSDERHIMADPVLESMIAQFMRLRFPQSVFAWQGGEPTLAGLDFFRRVVALEQQYGVSGQEVANALQTNGWLIDEPWCRFLDEYKFLVGLSLDGPQDVHDAMRPSPSGRSTWDKAMEASKLMDQHNVACNILCVVHAGNVGLGADLVRWFVREGFYYLQFIPCLEPGSAHNVTPEAYGDFLCDTFDYWAKEGFGQLSVRDFDAMVLAALQGRAGLCIYGKKCDNYIVIEHTGDVYPCDFFVYDEWKLGNIADSPLESFLECEKYRQFARQKHAVLACNGCEWRQMCHGGCQKDRRFHGNLSSPTPFCAAYKKFFKHAAPKIATLAKRARRAVGGKRLNES